MHRPVEVELEADERRVGLGEQHVVGDLPVEARELELVVVVAEPEPGVEPEPDTYPEPQAEPEAEPQAEMPQG